MLSGLLHGPLGIIRRHFLLQPVFWDVLLAEAALWDPKAELINGSLYILQLNNNLCFRRVAALEAKQSQHKEMQSGQGALNIANNARYQGLSPEDQAISERLAKLQQETKPSE